MITSKLNKLTSNRWYFSAANKNTKISLGKFSSGQSVLPNAIVFEFDVQRGGKTVTVPIEEGGYNTYNKMSEPTKVACTLLYKGTNSYLQGVLNNAKELKELAVTFSIVTPMYEYENMTLESYSYKHESQGTSFDMLSLAANFVEVPPISLTYRGITSEEAKSASSVSTVNRGLTQAKKTNRSALSELTGRVAKVKGNG